MQKADGNLVLSWLGIPIWASNTSGHGGAHAVMQRDGNFVIYAGTKALWSSGSGGHPTAGYYLDLEQDGNFQVIGVRAAVLYSSRTETVGVRFKPEASPAFAGDAGDPDVVYYAGSYYAFTTGTALGNHIQVVVSSSPTSGYRCTGAGSGCSARPQYGSSALPNPPAWEQPNTSTSPGVFEDDGHWVMFYDAALAGHSFGTGYDCLAVASAASLNSRSPVFTDHSRGPLLCQPQDGGVLDPMGFVDPRTRIGYVIWKSNDGSSSAPSRIWAARLAPGGTSIAGTPHEILYNNTGEFPFDTTLDDPFMAYANGRYFLMFTVGNFQSSDYREAYATCSSPLGPCTQARAQPFTSTYGHAYGPGGGSLFADADGDWWISYEAWNSATCQNYGCGAKRLLYVAPIDLGG